MEDIKIKRKLWSMFDYQEFAGNSRIRSMTEIAEQNFSSALSDDELSMVNAAGEVNSESGRDFDMDKVSIEGSGCNS